MNLPEWLRTGLEVAGIAGGLVSTASLVTAWAMSRGFVSKETFSQYREQHEKVHDAIGVRLDKGEQKFTGISSEMRHQPGYQVIETLRAEIGRLEASLREVAASERAMRERFLAIEGQLERVITHLLRQGTNHE